MPDRVAPLPNAPLNPPPGLAELTPAAVALMDEAVIEPSVGVVPWTVTVSPGFSALRDDFALRVTVADELSVTLTRLPLESVT